MKLPSKSAVVTGDASGIGKAIATAFAREGADVAILDITLGFFKGGLHHGTYGDAPWRFIPRVRRMLVVGLDKGLRIGRLGCDRAPLFLHRALIKAASLTRACS